MVILQKDDVAVYERTTHLLYFMRGAKTLCDAGGSVKTDIGPKKMDEVRSVVNDRSKPFSLMAEPALKCENQELYMLRLVPLDQ